MQKKPLLIAVTSFLVLKLFTTALVVVVNTYVPHASRPTGVGVIYDPTLMAALENQGELSKILLLPWYRWDAYHYILIAQGGYAAHINETVWPPLFPGLIWLFDRLFNSPLLSAMIISNLSAIAAFALFFKFASLHWDENVALKSMLLWISFPTAFFLIAAYTESLFIGLALGCLLSLEKKNYLLAGLLAGLASLVRLQGVFLVLPALWSIWGDVKQGGKKPVKIMMDVLLAVGMPVLSFVCFSLVVYFGLRAPFPWVTLGSQWHQHWGTPIEGLVGNITALAGRPVPEGFNPFSLSFDLIAGLLIPYGLIRGAHRMPMIYLIYGWTLLLVSTTKIDNSSVFVSLSRYCLVIFPAFVGLALSLKKVPFILWIIFSIISQAVLFAIFYLGGFVA